MDMCNMTRSYVAWLVDVTWMIDMSDSTHSHVNMTHWCDTTHSYVTWLIHMWCDSLIYDIYSRSHVTYVRHDSFICDVTHSYVTWLTRTWHDSFPHTHRELQQPAHTARKDANLAVICDTTHSYVTCLIHVCDMTHLYGMWLICDMIHS